MNILYYYWNENTANDAIKTFQELGHTVNVLNTPLTNYDTDSNFESTFTKEIHNSSIDLIFTFNYFPIISRLAEALSIPYACWVYDCPHLTLYSTTVKNNCNFFFIFDQQLVKTVEENGGKHVYHLPLASNFDRLANFLSIDDSTIQAFTPANYSYELSFVGSLYEDNMYRQITYLPKELVGYIDGVLNAQSLFSGTELLSEIIYEYLGNELNPYIKFETTNTYTYSCNTIYLQMLQKELTARERISYLQELALCHPLMLFSASSQTLCPAAKYGGCISYDTTMPQVFRHSKINLNISLRSITSGIPLRAIDILASGGFLLSNNQSELADYLVPDNDYVCYNTLYDLQEKADYYLTHEKKRTEIAYQGYLHAKEIFSYRKLLTQLLENLQ